MFVHMSLFYLCTRIDILVKQNRQDSKESTRIDVEAKWMLFDISIWSKVF